jgi:ubiquinone/menaquinone biosynthesis C-methylase UbiE
MLVVARSVTPSELGIEWYEASADAIPLPDKSFDVVLCQLSLQFVPTGKSRCKRCIGSWLREGVWF